MNIEQARTILEGLQLDIEAGAAFQQRAPGGQQVSPPVLTMMPPGVRIHVSRAIRHALEALTSSPWCPIEECGELERGRYLVQLRSGAQLVALWSGDSEGWVLRQRDLDEFDSPRDITHVHQLGTIRGPGETDGNV